MPGLAAIGFENPWALAALLALPILWWLLRYTPPRPERIRFPPLRLLLDLVSREETPDKTPWWLIALRVALASAVILAVARPLIVHRPAAEAGAGPLLIVVDDGWAAARDWPLRRKALAAELDAAQRAGRPVALAATAPRETPQDIALKAPADIRPRADLLAPRALKPDRAGLARELAARFAAADALEVLWLADGLDHGDAQAFAAALVGLAQGRAAVRVLTPPPAATARALAQPVLSEGRVKVTALRAEATGPEEAMLRAIATNGRNLAESRAEFAPAATAAEAQLELPLALRNEIARVELAQAGHAAAVFLFDDRWRRKAVGFVAGGSLESSQPLLSPLYYASRALEPYAETAYAQGKGDSLGVRELIDAGLSLLVLADVGQLGAADRKAVEGWVEKGGVLLRFAGPRLAAADDGLVPVRLRRGGRALGGALSWEQPQPLAPFDAASPFAGLKSADQVLVTRQVLAEPDSEIARRAWSSLADGTPLVTAERRGGGLIVLFHVTANADWSNLPLSGLFVEMLRRILDLAPGVGAAAGGAEAAKAAAEAAGAFTPVRVLTGTGELAEPPAEARPIAAAEIDKARPGPFRPAGLYRRSSTTRAVNLAGADLQLAPIRNLPGAVAVAAYDPAPPTPLAGPLFIAALALLLADAIAVLVMAGAFARLRAATVRLGVVLALCGCALAPVPGGAQERLGAEDQFALRGANETRLVYVMTGDQRVDQTSFAGLMGLNDILLDRTAVQSANPIGIDIERDEIVFFPLLYWPLTPEAPELSAKARAKVDAYLKNGGTIFFDTRDHQLDVPDLDGEGSPASRALKRTLAEIDLPALEPVPPDHVLTKAFYLLQSFPGRWAGGKLWVEAGGSQPPGGSTNYDGVSSVIIGSNDYAAAWAVDAQGRPMFPATPGGDRQRELAYRVGVNIVMYALTGNYKADQVHVPALLERLGQ